MGSWQDGWDGQTQVGLALMVVVLNLFQSSVQGICLGIETHIFTFSSSAKPFRPPYSSASEGTCVARESSILDQSAFQG